MTIHHSLIPVGQPVSNLNECACFETSAHDRVEVASRKRVKPMGNPRRANGHRRDQIRRRVLAAYTHCALCGLEVDKTLHYLDPGAPEVDEIIPVSLGGDPLAWSNVQLTHRLCNQRKGNNTTPKPPRTITKPTTSKHW